jgi:glycosyltransferase involved in cell wall biosynthesis
VLHVPAAVGGHPPQLARAERELGLDSRCVTADGPPFGYEVDEVLFRGNRLGREVRRWRLLLHALRKLDVVHFNFGSSLVPPLYGRLLELRDVSLLRRAGKPVFVTFQGDDARPGFRDEGRRRRTIDVFGRHADRIYALNPDLLAFLPERAEYLPYASVDPREWSVAEPSSNPVPVLAHAPSDRVRKGTKRVLEASHELRERGIDHELDLVEGVVRTEARRRLARADVLVDQLVVGWYGGAAVEAMALGRPVVAHVRDEDLAALPGDMAAELPVVRATAANLTDVLADLLTTQQQRLPELGRRSRAYVERWHDPRAIAARTKRAYEQAVAESRR